MGGLFEAASGVLERRTLVTAFLPVLAFAMALLGVVLAGVGWAAALRWWSALDVNARILLSAATLLAGLLLTQIVASQRTLVLRLLEGYWDTLPGGRRLAGRGRERHQRLYAGMDHHDPRMLTYPIDETRFMPTRLGNLLRGAEEHSRERYGIDAVRAWPRLYPTLPEVFRQSLASAATAMEMMATVTWLGLGFSIAGGILAALLLPWYGVAACVWGGVLVAWLGYRATVRVAEPYAMLFRSAFDVYRWGLLDAMGLSRPVGYGEEPERWRQLDKLWAIGAIDSQGRLGYPAEAPPAGDAAPVPGPDAAPPVIAAPPGGVAPPDSATPLGGAGPDAGASPVEDAGVSRRDASAGRRWWPLAVVVVAGVLAAAVGQLVDLAPAGTPRAAQALPPYHVLVSGDVEGWGASALMGRYPLKGLPKGAELPEGVLGPRLPSGALAGKAIVTLRPGRLSAGVASAGAVASLRIPGDSPLTLDGVLILNVLPDTLTVAVWPGQLDPLLAKIKDSELYVVTVQRP
ncbi:hypothetical protein AB0C27_54760 [Nonomuraea sp. NPDC048882]|uniref:hypothetical protein n=2 Tax=Actinomycetes TaxID=1760 RepID=UPI0033D80DC2